MAETDKAWAPLYQRTWLICATLAVLALLIRLPKLQLIPGFIESNDLRITLDIYHGDRFPLNDFRSYLGALTNYFVAGIFWLVGLHYWVPRIVLVVFSSLTIPLVYLFGKRLIGNTPALVGAILLSGSLYHVLFLSHVPWPNSYSPFLVVLVQLLFLSALQDKKINRLVLAGFLFGLALQTHPSVITLAPSFLAIFLLQSRDNLQFFLRQRSTYLAIPATVLGYANMIYFHIQRRLGGESGMAALPRYTSQDMHPQDLGYLSHLENAWVLLLRLLSGAFHEIRNLSGYFHDPVFVICGIFLIAGVFVCLKKRKWELPIFLFFPMMLIPVLNPNYDFYLYGRYLGFLMPVGYLLVTYSLSEILRKIPNQQKFAIAFLWIALPVAFLAFHLNNVKNEYAYFEKYTDDTMKLYRDSRLLLSGKYDRKKTVVLVDRYMFKATPMIVYLQTDGWSAQHLAGTSDVKLRKSNVVDPIVHQIAYLQSQRERQIVAIVSLYIVKPLIESGEYALFISSLEGGPGVPPDFMFFLSPKHGAPDPSKIRDPFVTQLIAGKTLTLGHRRRHHVLH